MSLGYPDPQEFPNAKAKGSPIANYQLPIAKGSVAVAVAVAVALHFTFFIVEK